MKKYLIRSGIDFSQKHTPNDVFFNRLIAGNSGNMMFIYGIMNVLTTYEQQVIPSFYKLNFTNEEIEDINSTYDAFLIPLADAFRPDFIYFLNCYTELIKKLKIPCILMSAGIRAPISCDGDVTFSFDNDVKRFIDAILDHSTIAGIRGDITAQYLERLGYIRDKHFTVIGCPSLYTYGDNIHINQDAPINSIGFGLSPYENSLVEDFFNHCIEDTKNSILLFQLEEELRYSYLGIEPSYFQYISTKRKSIIESMENDKKTRFFYNVTDWLPYLRNSIDLFIGDRFHGVVSSILASKKHIIIPIDARTKELAEFHGLTRIYENEIDINNSVDYSKICFNSFELKQKENLKHYVDFLRKNQLNSVFDDKQYDISPGKSPFELGLVGNDSLDASYMHYTRQNIVEKISRKASYYMGKTAYSIKSRMHPEIRG